MKGYPTSGVWHIHVLEVHVISPPPATLVGHINTKFFLFYYRPEQSKLLATPTVDSDSGQSTTPLIIGTRCGHEKVQWKPLTIHSVYYIKYSQTSI